jgi:hypothetical protein
LNRPHHDNRNDRSGKRRHRHAGGGERRQHRVIPLTDEGFPAATPDAPRPSPVVHVSDDTLARHPWLPRRVIAGSVWRGPRHERLRVIEDGSAVPWRGPAAVRRS